MKTSETLSNKDVLETKYNNSRHNLLLVVVFTVINIVLLITKSESYFLFSAYIPYALVTLGMLLCGMFPEEYYGEDFAGMEFLGSSVFTVFLVIAIIFTALYLVSWIFSKKNKVGWLIFALVIFSIDTLGMFALMEFATESIIDIVFHAWVIISLAIGINACRKLKKIPADEIAETEIEQTDMEKPARSEMIRVADLGAKARILLEAEALGHHITYRRVKKVNELVIDGNVYDEMEALLEFAHSLQAEIDGHLIEVGFDGNVHSYLEIDGEIVTKKMRLY